MMKILALVTVVLSLLADTSNGQVLEQCRTDAYPPRKEENVAVEIVNLDLPPQERWSHIVIKKKERIKKFVEYLKDLMPSVIFDSITNFLAKGIEKFPQPYGDEIVGIAKALNMPLAHILTCNIFYELEKFCTSIVAQDEDGNIFHGRNLDLGAFLGWDLKDNTWNIAEMLRPMTVAVDFQSGGKTLYRTIQFAGTVGVFTGVAPGKFSFSLNSRSPSHFMGGPLGVFSWITNPSNHHRFASILARDVFEKAQSYEDAKDRLSNTPLLASVYYILAGTEPNEGVVISRSQSSSLQPMKLTNTDRFLVQTNYDHWKNAPFYDNRRKPAIICMKQFTNSNSSKKNNYFDILYNVLSTIPVRNKATIYTALMNPATGDIRSYRRQCGGACYPW